MLCLANLVSSISAKIVFAILFLVIFKGSYAVTFEQDVSLTESQVKALAEFKEIMLPKIKADFMKEDIYLVKFLQAKKFDIGRAETMLNTYLEWRKSTNFDNLTDADFADLEYEFPYEVLGVDKQGKPLLQMYVSDWDLRKAAVGGLIDRHKIYVTKMYENAWLKVRDLQKQGQNVTRFTTLLELSKISYRQHLSPSCMPMYINGVTVYDQFSPKQGDVMYAVNTPAIAEVVVTFSKSLMDEETAKLLQVYGRNAKEWMAKLYKDVDPSQLTEPFGGTMPSKFGF